MNKLYTKLFALLKFQQLNIAKFKLVAAITLITSDILNFIYLKSVFFDGAKLKTLLANSLMLAGYSPNEVPPELFSEMKSAFISTFTIFMICFLINNFIFYTLFYKDKPAGRKFVRGYALFGFILTLYNCFHPETSSLFLIATLIGTTAAYLYIYLGVKFFFDSKK